MYAVHACANHNNTVETPAWTYAQNKDMNSVKGGGYSYGYSRLFIHRNGSQDYNHENDMEVMSTLSLHCKNKTVNITTW